MFNMIFRYCMLHEIVDKDYASLFSAIKVEAKIDRIPYTPEEIQTLWKHTDVKYVDTVLFALYTGCRPMEVFTIRSEDVHLDDGYMRGGIKTEAGMDRVIPMTYDAYKGKHIRLMKTLGLKHYPADLRHTFITCAKEKEMNEYLLKLIVGHAIVDVTEKTYTHRKIKQLVEAINIIDYLPE